MVITNEFLDSVNFQSVIESREQMTKEIIRLNHELLISQENQRQLNLDFSKREKERERKHAERLEHAKTANAELVKEYSEQIDGLKRQIRK